MMDEEGKVDSSVLGTHHFQGEGIWGCPVKDMNTGFSSSSPGSLLGPFMIVRYGRLLEKDSATLQMKMTWGQLSFKCPGRES
jgi:hypothetical protein